MVNVLMLSKWHVHAAGYAKTLREQPDATITCVFDDDAACGKAWADELGVPFEPNLDAALARKDVDAVLVDTKTSDHCRVIVKAAEARKHIFTEKALAPTLKECNMIAKAVKKSGVTFCISYPSLTAPLVQLCRQSIDAGLLGNIHYLRMRMAHDGASRGWLPEYWYDAKAAAGGAMMDLGCHPNYVASYLLGKPARIAAMFNNTVAPGGVDDNAVSVVEFENKAIAVLETSFISPYQANCFELLGTEGAIVQIGDEIKMRTNQFDGGWYTPAKLPEPLPFAIRMWLDGIEHGTEVPFDLEKGIALTELLENAYISDREQRIVKIN